MRSYRGGGGAAGGRGDAGPGSALRCCSPPWRALALAPEQTRHYAVSTRSERRWWRVRTVVRTEAQLRGGLGGPAADPHRPRRRHLLRDCHRRPDPRVAVPAGARRARAHDPPDLLREAAAAPGRHRLPRPPRRGADPRRLGRPGRRAHLARRDPPLGLRDRAEPRPRSRVAGCSRCAASPRTAATSTATWPTTTAAASTRAAVACRSTTRC